MSSFLNRSGRRRARQPAADPSPSVTTGEHSSPDEDWDELGLSSGEYARRRRELMQLISDLRSLGASTMIDVPSVVVIGGQSAGKSSLVEAVSGVHVPRDSGTCTRCPMECTMSANTTTWSCEIRLRFDYESNGSSATQPREVVFGPTLTNKDEVEVWLRRAQSAILNPDLSPESFHRMSIQDLRIFTSPNSLKFSQNVVSVFIRDPAATDLSFVDLPGLIQNEDPEVVELVRKLTQSYISRPNVIILTTIPMSDDMQNQESVRLAREADPEGERTIGILTKPDMLGDGAVNARRQWIDIIEGRQHMLRHGYYCVRLPDDAQRAQGLSRSALQRIAADFLDTTSPWSEVTDRGRFGIPAFVSNISILLVDHIRRVIPQLRQDVERLLASCLDEICTLPGPLETDPQSEVLARVSAFCDAFKGVVSGASSDKSLARRNRSLYAIFAGEIRGTAPDFRPFEQPQRYRRMSALEPDEAAVIPNTRVQTMGVLEVRKTIMESIAWELPGNIPYEAKIRLINEFTSLWSSPMEKCLTSINDVLDDLIRQLVKTHFGRFKVLHDQILDLIRGDIEEHKSRALSAIKKTLDLEISPSYTQNLSDYHNIRDKWLAKYRNARQKPGWYENHEEPNTHAIGSLWGAFATSSPSRIHLPEPVEVESAFDESTASRIHHPQPMGVVLPPDEGTASRIHLSKGKVASDKSMASPEALALRYLAQAGYKDLTAEDLARLSSRDKVFDDELTVMADVRAYFTIACKRIIDHVPLRIEHSLHHALAERLSVSLFWRLLVGTAPAGDFADRMTELVSEDPEIKTKRIRLEAERNRLQEIKKRLVDFVA